MSVLDHIDLSTHVHYVDVRTWARHTGLYAHVTRRAAARARRDWNAERRAWLLSLGPQRRREVRLDPPCDYDEIPF